MGPFHRGIITAAIALLVAGPLYPKTVQRGRNEGTLSIPASNVTGNGNITGSAGSAVSYGIGGLQLDPTLGACIGLGDIMQLSGQLIPTTSGGIGPMKGHLQITMPGNNTLRFLGVALCGNLYLSASQDTLSEGADTGKPVYSPALYATVIADIDFLARWKRLPLKAYLFAGMADCPRLLHRYSQLSFVFGGEWKLYRHGFFCDLGIGLFREKASKFYEGDTGYEQSYLWLKPGMRYRLFNRISVLGGMKMSLFSRIKKDNPVDPDLFGIELKCEMPLFFRETNTEAIRTLVFLEQNKQKEAQLTEQTRETSRGILSEFDRTIFGDTGTGTFDYEEEQKALIRRRKEIQSKMEDIERLLQEDEGK